VLGGQATAAERRAAYAADVTYGGHQELSFDSLRDNMALSVDEVVQRGRAFAGIESRPADRSGALAGSLRQASDLFQRGQERIAREAVTYIFHARVEAAEQA
jgi:preprotein translocase subunit SecA